jgi:hypothetical protein
VARSWPKRPRDHSLQRLAIAPRDRLQNGVMWAISVLRGQQSLAVAWPFTQEITGSNPVGGTSRIAASSALLGPGDQIGSSRMPAASGPIVPKRPRPCASMPGSAHLSESSRTDSASHDTRPYGEVVGLSRSPAIKVRNWWRVPLCATRLECLDHSLREQGRARLSAKAARRIRIATAEQARP